MANEKQASMPTNQKDEANVPDRYFTPQLRRSSSAFQYYTPTPHPETVTVSLHGVPSDKDPCCLGCLLACFFCCMVKNDSASVLPTSKQG